MYKNQPPPGAQPLVALAIHADGAVAFRFSELQHDGAGDNEEEEDHDDDGDEEEEDDGIDVDDDDNDSLPPQDDGNEVKIVFELINLD